MKRSRLAREVSGHPTVSRRLLAVNSIQVLERHVSAESLADFQIASGVHPRGSSVQLEEARMASSQLGRGLFFLATSPKGTGWTVHSMEHTGEHVVTAIAIGPWKSPKSSALGRF